jgi:hypothetical protein
MKKIFTLVLSVAFAAHSLFSQQLDHVLGDVMITLKPGADVRQVVSQLQTFNGRPTQLKIERKISDPLRAWLLHFDFTTINENLFLAEIHRRPQVVLAQFNHLIRERSTTPNDPAFGQQWQWLNNGGSGGTADADVDADLAWDITTGGQTATGKDIVVCILEGTNRNHPDLQGNLWFNQNEIPNNGADDDNNGYVDDYNGWNITQDNDNIPSESHGTTVAGMIGAKGNNSQIVAGINWDVTIMNVEFGGVNEANAVESYTYPLVMRRLYNQTNGAKGAFVVATNASWGIDNGNPANSPIWCAMYDSLGAAGVLSCGATANNNVNVDVVGDLPTACPSEYMIAVTATNRSDVRTFSGYGTTHIDVGAPGENIISLGQNGGPVTQSGTSFASPLTAGLIALLYSAPCPTIYQQAIADPAGAARKIRDAIFEGVDVKPNLVNEVKTGGRVNAFNSLQLLLGECGPCPQPFQVEVNNLSDVSATLTWLSTDSTLSTNLRWRIVGNPNWTLVEGVAGPLTLDWIVACTEYEFQMEDLCASETSGFSGSYFFKSDGCCEAPPVFTVNAITDSSATVNWSFVLAANTYDLELVGPGETQLLTLAGNETSLLLDLESCTEYSIRIRTVCDTGATQFNDPLFFRTLGCGACLDRTYCTAASTDASSEWIANVSIGSLNNTTASDNGYGDYTGLPVDLMTYSSYPISLTPGFLDFPFPEWFSVWIDFNQDGDFSDPGEEVYDPGNATTATVSGNVIIPGSAVSGLTRMRVVMQWNSQPTACNDGFDYGEVEDYCINIVPGTPPDCPPPGGLGAGNIGFTVATLNWSAVGSAQEYDVRFHLTGAAGWTVINATNNTFTLSNLAVCEEYEFQVRSNCIGFEGDWSPGFVFMTECYPPCDEIPGGLDTSNVTATAATLHWSPTANAQNYRIRYKKTSASDWTSLLTGQTTYNLGGLAFCTEYEFTVQATCIGNQESDESEPFVFTTSCVSSAQETVGAIAALYVYPNPFRNSLTVGFSLPESCDMMIELFDARGRRLGSTYARYAAGKNQLQLTDNMDVAILSPGIYWVKLTTNDGYGVSKVVKE